MRFCKTTAITALISLAGLAALGGLSGCGSGDGMVLNDVMKDLMPPSPGEVARDAFNVYDADRRRASVNQLSNADWGGEAPYLRTYRLLAAEDPDPTVRAAALRALGRHGGIEDVPVITINLNDRTGFVRWEAAMALQRLHHDSAVEPLIKSLRSDEEADVRQAAANALAQYPQPKVFQALVGALSDDDYGVVDEAAHALHILTGQGFNEDGAAWLAWADNRQDLFAQQQTYFFPQFDRPVTFGERVQFWKRRDEIVPQEPRATEVALETMPVLTPPPAPAPQAAPAPVPAPLEPVAPTAPVEATPAPAVEPTAPAPPAPAAAPAAAPKPVPKHSLGASDAEAPPPPAPPPSEQPQK